MNSYINWATVSALLIVITLCNPLKITPDRKIYKVFKEGSKTCNRAAIDEAIEGGFLEEYTGDTEHIYTKSNIINENRIPIRDLIKSNCIYGIKSLVKEGYNIGKSQTSYICLAARFGNTQTLKYFLKIDKRINETITHLHSFSPYECSNVEIGSPLVVSVKRNNYKSVKLLLESGFDLNRKDRRGDPPIMVAARNGFHEIIHLLENFGADLMVENPKQINLLMEAAKSGSKESVNIFLKGGIDINQEDNFGMTAYLYAIKNQHWNLAAYLVRRGATKILVPENKITPWSLRLSEWRGWKQKNKWNWFIKFIDDSLFEASCTGEGGCDKFTGQYKIVSPMHLYLLPKDKPVYPYKKNQNKIDCYLRPDKGSLLYPFKLVCSKNIIYWRHASPVKNGQVKYVRGVAAKKITRQWAKLNNNFNARLKPFWTAKKINCNSYDGLQNEIKYLRKGHRIQIEAKSNSKSSGMDKKKLWYYSYLHIDWYNLCRHAFGWVREDYIDLVEKTETP